MNEELEYTHKGLFCGLVPVHMGNMDTEMPNLTAAPWVPEWYFTFVISLFGTFTFVWTFVDPEAEPVFPMIATGKLEKSYTLHD